MSDSVVKQYGRIMYVEPNDVAGSINGIPLTPDYEDYCIGFNLIAECVKRYQPNIITASGSSNDSENVFEISWTSKSSDSENGDNWVSFMSGEEVNGKSFLTTYYTDITFNTVKSKNIVEGLGVENVTVSFESYYTPTVTIKFVDVRGSSLFGREEAIHNSDGTLTAENIFGCFMTLPYPKFKLQLKGFYGKAVTYQLTVANFRGNFNSNNGNFEITIKFIGYSYSLLTDIPLIYLVAAPYCNYEGKSYWEEKKNTAAWQLDNGSEPPKLFSLMKEIDSAITERDNGKHITDDEKEETTTLEAKNELLNKIQDCLNQLINELKNNATDYILTDNQSESDETIKNYKQLLCLYNKIDDEDECIRKFTTNELKYHEELVNALSEYNTTYSNDKIDKEKYFQQRSTVFNKKYEVKDLLEIETSGNDSITNVTIKGKSDNNVSTIQKIQFEDSNTKYNPTYTMAVKLNDKISSPYDNKKLGRYAALFYWQDLETVISEKQSKINDRQNEIEERVSYRSSEELFETLSFTPHIGNIFKIIMCHLETLCYIISRSVIDISNSNRDPSYLGINIESTDAKNIETIPAWPGMYNNGKEVGDCGYISSDSNILAWPGDFSHNFIEEEVIKALRSAIMRIETSGTNNSSKSSVINSFPILPCDLNKDNSPFYSAKEIKSLSSLAGYVGIRMAQIFGVMYNGTTPGSTLCEIFGKMDAFNFYKTLDGKIALNDDFINALGSGNFAEVLKNIMLCNTSGDIYASTTETNNYYHDFENNTKLKDEYNSKNRCPILLADSSNYKFIRYYDVNSISLVPAMLNTWKRYKNEFIYVGEDSNNSDAYFTPSFDVDDYGNYFSDNFLHISNASQVIDDTSRLTSYYNEDLFDIITDSDEVKEIKNKYETLSDGQVNLTDYNTTVDFSPLLEQVWLVGDDKYCEYYDNSLYVLTQTAAKLGIDEKYLLGDSYSDDEPEEINYNDWWEKGKKRIVKYTSNGELTMSVSTTADDGTSSDSNDTITTNELIVQQSHIAQGDSNTCYSLFGHVFYYLQNEKLSGEEDNESAWNERKVKSKCLLFLNTLNFNLDKIPNFLKSDKECGTIEKVPYGYLLLLGGMLWRIRYYLDNNIDPIISEYGSVSFQSNIAYALSNKFSDSSYRFKVYTKSDSSKYNTRLTKIFGGSSEKKLEIDYHVENRLINMFEYFAENTFCTIIANCELTKKKDSKTTSEFTSQTFSSFIKEYRNLINNSSTSVSDAIDFLNENVVGIFGKYSAVYIDNSSAQALKLLLREDNDVQDIIKALYYQESVVLDTGKKKLNKNSNETSVQVSIPSSCINNYIDAFTNQLEEIAEGDSTAIIKTDDDDDKVTNDRDLNIQLYYYIKNLYDKWLISAHSDTFNVDNFFKNNFIFIDKFYMNIYSKLTINCDLLSEIYHSKIDGKDASLFSFIGDITGTHHCLFVALPDFIDYGESAQDRIEAMEKLFKPLSFNEGMTAMQENNHFVIIYTGIDASNASETNDYKYDGFSIVDTDTTVINNFSTSDNSEDDEQDLYTRYGYGVPAFGVSFARQNQHIFKNISVSMDNPMDTDISIRTTYGVALKGSKRSGNLVYYGQDIYNIYNSYSYQCDIEMMGNAQIQPLMYFQLNNIPMWHGAYVILSVTHTMTPGNMVTKIKGQKISKYNTPYTTQYVTQVKELSGIDSISKNDNNNNAEENDSDSSDSSATLVAIQDSYTQSGDDITCDKDMLKEKYLSSADNVSLEVNGVELNDDICLLVCQLINEVEIYSDSDWTIVLSSAVRETSSNTASEHLYNSSTCPSNAVDIQIATLKNGKAVKKSPKDASKLFTVMDILATNHIDQVGQLIFEGSGSVSPVDGTGNYQSSYTCLHLSCNRSTDDCPNLSSKNRPEIFISENANGSNLAVSYCEYSGSDTNKKEQKRKSGVEKLSANVPLEYKAIAKKFYENASYSEALFRKIFIYYKYFTDDELEEHFGEEKTSSTVASKIDC